MAVILCDSNQERKYKALVSGKTLLESCLHVNLSEHLNSEIGLGTITDLATAKGKRPLYPSVLSTQDHVPSFATEWLHNSFLFQRIQKNPRHYALGKASDQTWQSRLDELVESSIGDLQNNGLVSNNGNNGQITSTEYGEIMSKVRKSFGLGFRAIDSIAYSTISVSRPYVHTLSKNEAYFISSFQMGLILKLSEKSTIRDIVSLLLSFSFYRV